MLRSVTFVVVGAATFIGLALVPVVISMIEGYGISCDQVCGPTQRFMDQAAPWPVIVFLALALASGWVTAHPRH